MGIKKANDVNEHVHDSLNVNVSLMHTRVLALFIDISLQSQQPFI